MFQSSTTEGGHVLRHYSYYRPAILVLLKERESHGYELAGRMCDLGFDQRLASSIYKVLRDMEDEQLIASSWDVSEHGGPPRRVYTLTDTGDRFLHDSAPTLLRQRQALDAMLDLYSSLDGTAAGAIPVGPTPEAEVAATTTAGKVTQLPPARRARTRTPVTQGNVNPKCAAT
jgi:PadR family transcriptional regulator PadR